MEQTVKATAPFFIQPVHSTLKIDSYDIKCLN